MSTNFVPLHYCRIKALLSFSISFVIVRRGSMQPRQFRVPECVCVCFRCHLFIAFNEATDR